MGSIPESYFLELECNQRYSHCLKDICICRSKASKRLGVRATLFGAVAEGGESSGIDRLRFVIIGKSASITVHQKKIPPSIRTNRELEFRVVKELLKILPISHIVYEYVKAKGNKGFSPVMVAQKWMLQRLEGLRPTTTQYGWETSIIREHLGLEKNKTDKSAATPETHANDGVALASSHFVKYQKWQLGNSHGHNWFGEVTLTNAPFVVIARPNIYRRQLHFEKPDSKKPNPNQYRKRKGGTVTPFGFRSGDLVYAEKAGRCYTGWIGGYTQTKKTKNVSLYDINWERIGQFTPSKVKLLQRATGLLIGSKVSLRNS